MDQFERKKPIIHKLLSFGFRKEEDRYVYQAPLMEGSLEAVISIQPDSEIKTDVFDPAAGEPYYLYHVQGAQGAFASAVRAELEALLYNVAEQCFERVERDIVQEVTAYIRERYDCEPEYLWEKFPNYAAWRRNDNQKWFALLTPVSKRKLGFEEEETVELLNLRMEPEQLAALIDRERYFPGYYMNKKYWAAILLNGSVSMEEICIRIEASYQLVGKGKK